MADEQDDGTSHTNPHRNLMKVGVFKIVKMRTIKDFPERQHEEIRNGGKIILPETVLYKLNGSLNIPSPFICKIVSGKRHVLCGVISFSGENGRAAVPEWMMKQLQTTANTCVTLYVSLKPYAKGERVIFQPLSTKFLEITDPKAVLERSLRNFACLTKRDTLDIQYNNDVYPVLVTDTKPETTINIIDCDLEVDFIAPPGYKEPVRTKADKKKEAKEESKQDSTTTVAIPAFRADGKALTKEQKANLQTVTKLNKTQIHAPDFDYKPDSITFMRKFATCDEPASKPPESPSTKPPVTPSWPSTPNTGSKPNETNADHNTTNDSIWSNNSQSNNDIVQEEIADESVPMEEDEPDHIDEEIPLTRSRARLHGIMLPDMEFLSLGNDQPPNRTSGPITRSSDKRSQAFSPPPTSPPKRRRRRRKAPNTI